MLTFLRTKLLPSRGFRLITCTARKWQKDGCLEMGAALSYYSLFSLFPILLTIVSVAGFLLGPETTVSREILQLAASSLPPRAFRIIEGFLLHLNQQSVRAGSLGLVLMMLSASSVFAALDRSVDRIWKVDQEEESADLLQSLTSVVIKKGVAFAVVISTSILLLLSLLLRIAAQALLRASLHEAEVLSALAKLNISFPELPLSRFFQSGSSLLLLFLAICLLLYFLPSTFVAVRDLMPGASLATLSLVILQQLMSRNILVIGKSYISYGVIGSVMVLMLWIFLVCQVFLIACEFTYVYSHLYGSRRRHPLLL
jgi:membrane protein